MDLPFSISPQTGHYICIHQCLELDSFDIKTLSAQESSLYHAISGQSRKREFLSLRRYLRDFLGREVHVHYSETGKPYIEGEDLELSVSHSGGLVAFDLNENQPAGIDIQHLTPKILRIAKKFLSEEEQAVCSGDLFKTTLFWSAKEALYKWYARRGLIFASQLAVSDFGSDRNTLTGTITTDDVHRTLTLNYHRFEDLVVVYVV